MPVVRSRGVNVQKCLSACSALIMASACASESPKPTMDVAGMPWEGIVARSRGTVVRWRMWRGDPSINSYIDQWVAPRLFRDYGITLQTVDGQGAEIVNQLVVEREAHATGSTDLVWINGDTFRNLRKERLLWGPWAQRLPNAALVDSGSPTIMRDFEQPLEGMESPWGRVQLALIYDTSKVAEPPRTVAELAKWIRAHPGRFTHDQEFTGMTFLKSVMYALSGGAGAFQNGFDERRYRRGSERLWSWLDSVRPFFWRGGTTYPAGVADLHRLFANGEIAFTMSYNQNEVVTKIRQGILPSTSRALVLRDASIANSHYLGIPLGARNPAGAMVVANFLLSPAAQFEKLRPEVWADGTALDAHKLPSEWSARFRAIASDPHAAPMDTLARYAQPEIAPEYQERLMSDWRSRIRARAE